MAQVIKGKWLSETYKEEDEKKKKEAYYLDYNNINLDCSVWLHSFRQLGRTQFFCSERDTTAKN